MRHSNDIGEGVVVCCIFDTLKKSLPRLLLNVARCVYDGLMFETRKGTEMEETLETAKTAARLLNGSSSQWLDAENRALRPMAQPLAEYGELRELAEAKREAAETLLKALDELASQ